MKKLVNDALRKGLVAMSRPQERRPYRVPAHSMGNPLPPYENMDKALQIAEQLEDEEILRKMSLGK